jgi:ribonuclease-3
MARSETSSVEEEATPYNELNVIISDAELDKLLQTYDVTEKYRDLNLYRKAFVHKSYCTRKNENFVNGNTNCPLNCLPLQEESNERLEFLGDSILGNVIAGYLFERYPDENEGFLTRLRTKLVNGKMLAHLSKELGLQKFVIISKQIEDNEGRNNLNILEDAFEALIAAIYIDFGSFDVVRDWIISVIETNLDLSDLIRQNNNYKDMMLKYYQQNFSYIPKFYEVHVETNSNNQKTYTVCLKDNHDNVIAVGSGSSKKIAENVCAKNAIDR